MLIVRSSVNNELRYGIRTPSMEDRTSMRAKKTKDKYEHFWQYDTTIPFQVGMPVQQSAIGFPEGHFSCQSSCGKTCDSVSGLFWDLGGRAGHIRVFPFRDLRVKRLRICLIRKRGESQNSGKYDVSELSDVWQAATSRLATSLGGVMGSDGSSMKNTSEYRARGLATATERIVALKTREQRIM